MSPLRIRPASNKALTVDDIAQTRRSVRELTKVEREIHEAVLSCTRAGASY